MGFIAGLLGGGNNFKAQTADTAQTDYNSALKKAMDAGALNPVDFSSSNQVAGQQGQLANMLFNQAQGNGPSVAQNMLNQATNQNVAQAASTLASQKGINPGLAARLILQNQANQGQQAAGQAAGLRAQEQLGALGQLGGALEAQRQQNIGQSLGQVQSGLSQVQGLGGLQNQQNAINVQNQMEAQRLNQSTAEENAKRGANTATGLLGTLGSALLSEGGIVPGRAPIEKDSPVNDTVPAMLSPGEIVVPKSAAKSSEKAKEFIDALKKRHKVEAGEEPNFGKVLAAQHGLNHRLSMLEKFCYGGMVK